ncbi:hypothetical protein T484DRAFT_1885931 [Baffinella frigidus]|nr:hypothetical protein T484DRAFT_1885931 [Cryptophyta sp. CCMP2293]
MPAPPPLLLIAAILSSAAITAGVPWSKFAPVPAGRASFLYRSQRLQLQFLAPDRCSLPTPAPVLLALRGGIDWMQSEEESAIDPESPRGLAGVFGWGKTDEFGEKVVEDEKPAFMRGMEEPGSAHDSESSDSEWRDKTTFKKEPTFLKKLFNLTKADHKASMARCVQADHRASMARRFQVD